MLPKEMAENCLYSYVEASAVEDAGDKPCPFLLTGPDGLSWLGLCALLFSVHCLRNPTSESSHSGEDSPVLSCFPGHCLHGGCIMSSFLK